MSKNELKIMTVQVRRGDKQQHEQVVYRVAVEPGESVQGILQYIYDNLDPSIGFAFSCRIGLCASCLVRVNGKVVRACTTLVEGDYLLIEPYKNEAVIRDLVTDFPAVSPAVIHVKDIFPNISNGNAKTKNR